MNLGPDRPHAIRSQYRGTRNLDARAALHARYSTNPLGWQRWIYNQLHIPLRGSILELGCGPAYLWQENAHRTPTSWRITLTDASTGMVRAAYHGLRASPCRFDYAVADAQSIPFPAGRFDAVIANHVLYHVPDQPRALSEICRVLVPGGRFYASTVGHRHMRELHGMLQRASDSQEPWGDVTAASFLLDDARDRLAPWFAGIDLLRYQDSLLVDAVAPLIAYARSMRDPRLDSPALARLAAIVEREIAANGAVRITKDSGLLTARTPVHASPTPP